MGRVGKVDPRYFYEKRIFLQPPISTQTHEGCFHGFIVEDHGKNDKSPGTSVSTGDFFNFLIIPSRLCIIHLIPNKSGFLLGG